MQKGFTLIELLIVIAIIALLTIVFLISVGGQVAKAKDAQRKSDVYALHNAIEEYADDHGSFPPEGITSTCGGSALAPYIKKLPCDPVNGSQYGYFLSSTTGGYRVCATLADATDPSIAAMGCNGPLGCGLSGSYNYCAATGVPPSAVGTVDQRSDTGVTPTPTIAFTPTVSLAATPTPTPISHGIYACSKAGICGSYNNPALWGCTIWWNDGCPQNACADIHNRCSN